MAMDLETKQQLANLLAKPAAVTQAHAGMLNTLVQNYPYYAPLHLLLAKANSATDNSEQFANASLYNGGNLLHRVLHSPESLKITPVNLVGFQAKAEQEMAEESRSAESDVDEQETFEEIGEVTIDQKEESKTDEDEIFDEISEANAVAAQTIDTSAEEETFEEITEIITIPAEEEVFDEIAEVTAPVVANTMQNEDIIPDELEIENIVSTDFFALENQFHSEPVLSEQKASSIVVAQPEEYDQEAEAQTVSKYDDDKLPYTFLWWLAKTRKEHEQIFQPYVTPKKTANPVQGELQQQYVEHIFHLQTPFNVGEDTVKGPIQKSVSHKGDEIIASFIKNEPQIRAPKADQINNENKAKKSAEDHNDLVSETLAAIYIEQMLYHKAIHTYEKLSLKFPEKSRYFADLIQSLEKKI